MIKALQKRFVIATMAVITILLAILLVIINVINVRMVKSEINSTLESVADAEDSLTSFRLEQEYLIHGSDTWSKEARDRLLANNFFIVRYNNWGQIFEIDASRAGIIDRDTAENYAEAVIEKGRRTGTVDSYRYVARAAKDDGYVIVFLDTTQKTSACMRVMVLSVTVGVGCWLLMLLVSILLSKKAIRPMAENIEKQKQFITDAGHELKTPLAIIQANTDALELYDGESKWSSNIKTQVSRMNGLVKNMLTLAKAEDGLKQGTPVDFDPAELLNENLCFFKERIVQKGIILEENDEISTTVHADKDQIAQIISILLDNAIKYCSEGGKLSTSVTNTGKTALTIKNSVDSIPECKPEKLFDRFYRGDSARTQNSGGYGIGLSMAKTLAELNGCKLNCEFLAEKEVVFSLLF